MPYANNKGADQPAHPRSLISTFVVRCLDSIIPLLAIAEISIFWLASVAEQTGLSLTWLRTPKTGFLMMWLIYMYCVCKQQRLWWVWAKGRLLILHYSPELVISTFFTWNSSNFVWTKCHKFTKLLYMCLFAVLNRRGIFSGPANMSRLKAQLALDADRL